MMVIQIDILYFSVEQMVMTSFGSPFGLTDPDPVGSLVTCPLEPILLYEGLE